MIAGSDLVMDVIAAADPDRKRAAIAKLSNHSDGASFDRELQKQAVRVSHDGPAATWQSHKLATKSVGTSFEASVISVLLQSVVPSKDTGFFGGGFAGGSFKSMLLDQFAEQIASAGGFGIAALVDSRPTLANIQNAAEREFGRGSVG